MNLINAFLPAPAAEYVFQLGVISWSSRWWPQLVKPLDIVASRSVLIFFLSAVFTPARKSREIPISHQVFALLVSRAFINLSLSCTNGPSCIVVHHHPQGWPRKLWFYVKLEPLITKHFDAINRRRIIHLPTGGNEFLMQILLPRKSFTSPRVNWDKKSL